jgi:acetyl esterase/lipase
VKRVLAGLVGGLMVATAFAGPVRASDPTPAPARALFPVTALRATQPLVLAGSLLPTGSLLPPAESLVLAEPLLPVESLVRGAALAPDPGYLRVRTEAYGADPLQRATVMRWSTSTGRRPVVYFVHGGSWVMGSPGRWSREAKTWAQRGWTAINVSYRLGVDGRLMLADLKKVTDKYRALAYADPKRQLLVGDSAGAHLATLLAARTPARFRGVVAWSPVVSPDAAIATGLLPAATSEQVQLGRRAQEIWGFTHRTNTALSYVSPLTPPLWVAASTDEWVPYTVHGAPLCEALGSRCQATLVPGTTHGARLATTLPALADQALAWAESVTR